MIERITEQFLHSARLQEKAAEELSEPIAEAIELLFTALTNGGKVLACACGWAQPFAAHFADLLVGQYQRDRPGLAAIALSSRQPYARQVEVLGQTGDVLLVISPVLADSNVLEAITMAQEREMAVVALTTQADNALLDVLDEQIGIAVPTTHFARVTEMHLLVLHCLADGMDVSLFGEEDE